jgi:hypothetical protein
VINNIYYGVQILMHCNTCCNPIMGRRHKLSWIKSNFILATGNLINFCIAMAFISPVINMGYTVHLLRKILTTACLVAPGFQLRLSSQRTDVFSIGILEQPYSLLHRLCTCCYCHFAAKNNSYKRIDAKFTSS